MVTLCLTFEETAKLFRAAAPFTYPPAMGILQRFQFLHILANNYCSCQSFLLQSSKHMLVVFSCGFYLHFPNDYYIICNFVLIVAIMEV